ncbi:hypothetical protein Y032_0018g3563 [Ancylostoma ceylanicum]|uniref:Secreted protein n=1 Tax=Ancylostoma ceylanicum TaxID=53326 RepID=A0A016V495_9BILA|nr:hypothetical protein Y032_0018g3563 [Ancylostoma ceylanicum]
MKRFLHLLPSVALIGCTLHVTEFAKCLDFSALTNWQYCGAAKRDRPYCSTLETRETLVHSHITLTWQHR